MVISFTKLQVTGMKFIFFLTNLKYFQQVIKTIAKSAVVSCHIDSRHEHFK